MECCDQSWNFTNFAPELYRICIFFFTTKKLCSVLESLHFLTFSTKRHKSKVVHLNKGRKCFFIFFSKLLDDPFCRLHVVYFPFHFIRQLGRGRSQGLTLDLLPIQTKAWCDCPAPSTVTWLRARSPGTPISSY